MLSGASFMPFHNPSSMPSVAIVIVIWNGKEDTLRCLRSLSEDRYTNKHIIVVDNGSTDESVASIYSAFPQLTILQTGSNLGFTGGNNVGIRHALQNGADYVFLLNNDTVVEPDALGNLVKCAEANPHFGLLCPVIHYLETPNELWFSGSRLDLAKGIAVHDNSRRPARNEEPFELAWATGCALLVNGGLMRKLSGFDDRYYLSWEDVDLSLRVLKEGYRVVAVPCARIYHKVGAQRRTQSPLIHYYGVRNSLLFVQLHAGRAYIPAAIRIVLSFVRISLRPDARVNALACLKTVFQGVRDHLRCAYGPYKETSL